MNRTIQTPNRPNVETKKSTAYFAIRYAKIQKKRFMLAFERCASTKNQLPVLGSMLNAAT
ncbi:MAG: hypothetical protein E6Q37_09675 [Crocinitomicaceae bacterium]|nr:MAG: hypothetical protein E6Q37_09675 [Crocinitomicaceae bacterium]